MSGYRSRTSTEGRSMAGARALWRATGMKEGDFGKPIIAIDDGIAMGHGGMLYSLPGRNHIAECVEYMANAYCRARSHPDR